MTTFTTLGSQIEALYIAYLGRLGDPPGVAYWTNQLSSGAMTLAQVSASFAGQPEVKASLPYLSRSMGAEASTFIDQIFSNLFGHVADVAGMTYWLPILNAAPHTPAAIGQIVLDIIAGAFGADGAALTTRVDAHRQLGATLDNTFSITATPDNPFLFQPLIYPPVVWHDGGPFGKSYWHVFDTVNLVVTGSGPFSLQISDYNLMPQTDSGLPLWTTHLNLSGNAATTYLAARPSDYQNVVAIDASGSTGGVTITGASYFSNSLLGGNTSLTSFRGGTGADSLDISNFAQLGGFTTLDGGAGRDTLILGNSAAAGLMSGSGFRPSGFEIVNLPQWFQGAIDVQGLGSAVDTVTLMTVSGLTFNNTPSVMTVNTASGQFFQAVAGPTTFNGPSGANDVLNVTADMSSIPLVMISNGFETINATFAPFSLPQQQGGLLLLQATPTSGTATTVNIIDNGGALPLVIGAYPGAVLDVGSGTINISGSASGGIQIQTDVTAGVLNAGSFAVSPGSAGLAWNGRATSAINIIGSGAADTLTGSGANDVIANMASGIGGRGAGDVLTGGAGNDQFILRGDIAASGSTSGYGGAARITDMAVGTSGATDFISLSAGAADYAVNIGSGGLKAAITALGAGTIQSVAAVSGARAIVNAANEILKLTTTVVTNGSLQADFNTALGGSTITGAAANASYFFTLFDGVNNRMVIGIVNDTNGSNTTIEAGDSVALVGTADMSAATYASLNANHFQFIA